MFKKLARLPPAGAVAAASRQPARADGPKVGLDGPASLGPSAPGDRGPASSVVGRGGLVVVRWAGSRSTRACYGYLCAGGGKAMFVAAADLSTDCGREQSDGLRPSGR